MVVGHCPEASLCGGRLKAIGNRLRVFGPFPAWLQPEDCGRETNRLLCPVQSEAGEEPTVARGRNQGDPGSGLPVAESGYQGRAPPPQVVSFGTKPGSGRKAGLASENCFYSKR